MQIAASVELGSLKYLMVYLTWLSVNFQTVWVPSARYHCDAANLPQKCSLIGGIGSHTTILFALWFSPVIHRAFMDAS